MTGRIWAIVAVVGVVALGAGVGIGAAVWAGGDHGDDMGVSGVHGGADGGDARAATGERIFLEQMVPHHQSAVEMATLALERAGRAEVRRLAGRIISAQDGEIARMRAWHRDWFGEELVASGMGPHATVDLSELEQASGSAFDRAFLRLMIPHHASAIMMAEGVMMGSPRREAGTLAEEIIAAQSKEIGQMQRWREQWFPPLG